MPGDEEMPPVAQAKDPTDFILSSHEERLQKVEEGIGEMSKSLAENVTTTGHVVDAVKELGGRFDKAITELGNRMSETFKQHSDVVEVVKALQAEQKKSAERHATLKKIAWGIGLPLAGIVAKDGGAALVSFIATSLQHAK